MVKPNLIRLVPVLGFMSTTLLVATSVTEASPSIPQIDAFVSGVVRDYDNTPLESVAVFYFGTGANHGSTLTDANGLYTFTLSADTYEVSVSKIGYPPPDKQIIAVPPSRTDLHFIFPQRYSISGHVLDSESNPISTALVAAFGTGANMVTELTDTNGAYTLTLKADTYVVSASKTGYVDPPQQNFTVPPARSAIDFTLGTTAASITPSPTITFTPTPTDTVTPTATSTVTITTPNTPTIYLPSVVRQNSPTAVPTIMPSPTPTGTPMSGNHAPLFPQPLTMTVTTQNEFDNNGRLIGAISTIVIAAASDLDGDALTYGWRATTGSILEVSPDGLTGQWRRAISAGRIQGGKVTILVDDHHGGTAEAMLNFQ